MGPVVSGACSTGGVRQAGGFRRCVFSVPGRRQLTEIREWAVGQPERDPEQGESRECQR